jgi:hypothetical protein
MALSLTVNYGIWFQEKTYGISKVKKVPLDKDMGRHFLYVRYNADLSRAGLDAMGLTEIDSDDVRKMDSVKYIDKLQTVGKKAV